MCPPQTALAASREIVCSPATLEARMETVWTGMHPGRATQSPAWSCQVGVQGPHCTAVFCLVVSAFALLQHAWQWSSNHRAVLG